MMSDRDKTIQAQLDGNGESDLYKAFAAEMQRQRDFEMWRTNARNKGILALRELLPVAQGDTGQSRVVARFLLGLYNGYRFPFDLTDLRLLDWGIFSKCMTVLQMDYIPEREVHRYFDHGPAIFEQLARDWGLTG